MPERPNDGRAPEPTYEDRYRRMLAAEPAQKEAGIAAVSRAEAAWEDISNRIAINIDDIDKRQAKAIVDEIERRRGANKQQQPAPSSEQDASRLIQAIGDDNALKLVAIAQRKDLSGEEKMRAIVELDRRYIGKKSTDWATLLGVSPDAVRGYGFWKELQRLKKTPD